MKVRINIEVAVTAGVSLDDVQKHLSAGVAQLMERSGGAAQNQSISVSKAEGRIRHMSEELFTPPPFADQQEFNNLTRNGSLFREPGLIVVTKGGDLYGTALKSLTEIAEALAWQSGVTVSNCKKGAFPENTPFYVYTRPLLGGLPWFKYTQSDINDYLRQS
jgi:hypothetical protein